MLKYTKLEHRGGKFVSNWWEKNGLNKILLKLFALFALFFKYSGEYNQKEDTEYNTR